MIFQATLQQPKPLRRLYASSLKGFVDSVHPNYPQFVYTFVCEWLDSVGSDRETCCRLDSHLNRSDSSPVPSQLTRSTPDIGYTRCVDRWIIPSNLCSTGSQWGQSSTDDYDLLPHKSSASRPSFDPCRPLCRESNLALYHIFI